MTIALFKAQTIEDVLAIKIEDLKEAEANIKVRLMSMYPVGTRWEFNIMHGQKNPSVGVVVSHPGGVHAYVRFRLERKASAVTNRKHFVTVARDAIIGFKAKP